MRHSRPPEPGVFHKASAELAAWLFVGLMAMFLGTVGWALSIGLLLVGGMGAGVAALAGVDVPAWTALLAFAVGLPVGAWLEMTDVCWG